VPAPVRGEARARLGSAEVAYYPGKDSAGPSLDDLDPPGDTPQQSGENNMLILTGRVREGIMIGDGVSITVLVVVMLLISASHSADAQDSHFAHELLPQQISGVMESPADVCPTSWKSATEAKEMIVYLTGASRVFAEGAREMTAIMSKPDVPPRAAAGMARTISENRTRAKAMTACRDAITEKLGMDNAAVQQLYDYNTMTAAEENMFSDLEDNYKGQRNYFSNLLTISDQRRALHLIDLEVIELDYSIAQFRQMAAQDTGEPTEETDRKDVSREIRFRRALLVARASIAKKVGSPARVSAKTSQTPAITDHRTLNQKAEDCIHSPEMADASNVYLTCLHRLQGK